MNALKDAITIMQIPIGEAAVCTHSLTHFVQFDAVYRKNTDHTERLDIVV